MSNTYTDSTGRTKYVAPDAERDARLHDSNVDANEPSESIVGSVVEAAKSAGQRVKEAFAGPAEPAQGINENRDTTQSMKESGRTAKEKMMDTTDDGKAKGRDFKTSTKEKLGMDTTGDRAKDFGGNVKDRLNTTSEKGKDRLQNVNERGENLGYDAHDRASNDHDGLNADGSSTTSQKFHDAKEKVKDVVGAGTEKIKKAFSRTGDTTQSDTLAENQPASGLPSQYHTEDAKSKIQSAAAKSAEKTEDLAADAKHKTDARGHLHDKAYRTENWAADKKDKAKMQSNIHESNKDAIRNAGYNPDIDMDAGQI